MRPAIRRGCGRVGDEKYGTPSVVRLRARHLATALGTLPEDLRAGLAVVGVVALALVGALLAGVGTRLSELGAVVRSAGHQTRVQRREVGDVPAESGALLHVGVAETLVGTPFTNRRGLGTVLHTLALLVAQAVDLRGGV